MKHVKLLALLLIFSIAAAIAQTTAQPPGVAFQLLDSNTYIFLQVPLQAEWIEVRGNGIYTPAFGLSAIDANLTIIQIDDLTLGVRMEGQGRVRYYYNRTAPFTVLVEPPLTFLNMTTDYEEYSASPSPACYHNTVDGYVEVKAGEGQAVYFSYAPKESFVPGDFYSPPLGIAVPVVLALALVIISC